MIALRHGVVIAAAAIALAACGGTSGSSAPVPSSGSSSAADVTVTLTPSGSATSAQLSFAADTVRARLAAQGITVNTSVSSGAVTVSVPPSARAAVAAAAHPGVLSFREIYTDPSGKAYASPFAEGEAEPMTVTGLDAPSGEPNQTTPSPVTMAQFAAIDCSKNGGPPATIDEDPHRFVVACDRTGQMKYLLTPADLVGTQVASATATQGQGSSPEGSRALWEVDMTFRDSAIPQVKTVTSRLFHNNMQQLAITLDGVVLSAPAANGVLGANITLSGGEPAFSRSEAKGLASMMSGGALPVALTVGSPSG